MQNAVSAVAGGRKVITSPPANAFPGSKER
jgi:hypothetical protein